MHWTIEIYDYLKKQKGSTLYGYDKAGVTEAVKSANKVLARNENPITEEVAL